MEFHDCYALDYEGARAKFLTAARNSGARLHHYPHPHARGPAGEELVVDVACYGPGNAPRALLVVSGTHGLEGFCGSAAQLVWMKGEGPRTLAPDVDVVMVHAINPWGFAHLSRTTENNVDLNRNFIDHDKPHPENPGYAALHDLLLGAEWSRASIVQAQKIMDDYGEKFGADALFDTLVRGQYSHSRGLNYGGNQREWSNVLIETIVHAHLTHAQRLGFIDWHTGVGEYGEPFFLCFNDEHGPLFQEAARWWGDERIKDQHPHGKARPNYQGLLFHGVQRALDGRPMCGAVIEFGTRGWHMRRMLRLDLWLKFRGDPASDRYAMLQSDLLDSFCPADQLWRDSTIEHAGRITHQAIEGLSRWTDH